MRRKRQQLSEEECIDILNNATSGTLALLGDGGYPYSLPISFVYADGKIFFHSALKGHKIDAIRSCDKASFSVIQKDEVITVDYDPEAKEYNGNWFGSNRAKDVTRDV